MDLDAVSLRPIWQTNSGWRCVLCVVAQCGVHKLWVIWDAVILNLAVSCNQRPSQRTSPVCTYLAGFSPDAFTSTLRKLARAVSAILVCCQRKLVLQLVV